MYFQNTFTNIKTFVFVFNSTIQHEFLHSLGAFHVQSRPDRDNYVEIKWDNIKESQKHNFKKHSSALTYGLAYDPLSIMHYEYYAFAINKKKPTIVSKVCDNISCLEKKFNCSFLFRCQVYQPKNLDQLKQWEMVISNLSGRCMVAVSFESTYFSCHSIVIKVPLFLDMNYTTPKPACKNKNPDDLCNQYKGYGYCTHPQATSFMKEWCQKACSFC